MKTIRLYVVHSLSRPGMLSIRADPDDRSATKFYQLLNESGAKVGDVLELKLSTNAEEVS